MPYEWKLVTERSKQKAIREKEEGSTPQKASSCVCIICTPRMRLDLEKSSLLFFGVKCLFLH